MTRSIAALIIFLAGIALCRSGYVRMFEPDALIQHADIGEIVAYFVALDMKRWDDSKRNCVVVETRIRSDAGDSASRRFFADATNAWKFCLQHPAGERVDVSALGNGDERNTTTKRVLGGLGMIFLGGLAAIVGLALPPTGDTFASRFTGAAFGFVFLAGGISAASALWGGTVEHAMANWWTPVSCEVLDTRMVSTGKRTSQKEFAYRYSFKGVSYESVGKEFPLTSKESRPVECRVHPEAPWRSRLTWGFRPALLVALFPVPFLTIGIVILTTVLFPSTVRWIERTDPKTKFLREFTLRSIAVALVGSFAGMFLGVLLELWMDGTPIKWVWTALMILFAILVLVPNAKRRAATKSAILKRKKNR